MPITSDYHLHSSFSGDSKTAMEDMILRSIELGLKSICFTEHMDFDYPVTATAPKDYFIVNTDSYLYDLISFIEKYAGQITVNFGIEIGMQPHLAKENAKYIKEYDFDFVIASSHICNGEDVYISSFYEGKSDKEAYREYFESILLNIQKFTNFDVYGHLDYVVRYGRNRDNEYFYEDYNDVFEAILKLLIENEKGLEINTGGMKYDLKELHPTADVLKLYRELGGEIITVGSDAHKTSNITRGFDRAAEVLKECGFKYYTVFEKRMASFLPL